jgi:hypothetical protein
MPNNGLIEAISKIIQPELFTNDFRQTGDGEMTGLELAKSATREMAQQIIASFEGYLD